MGNQQTPPLLPDPQYQTHNPISKEIMAWDLIPRYVVKQRGGGLLLSMKCIYRVYLFHVEVEYESNIFGAEERYVYRVIPAEEKGRGLAY